MEKMFYVICDNIRSLENIGSIFRTSDALGVSKIFLCGISGKPPNHKISKTALGAEKTIPFEYCRQTWRLIERLKKSKKQMTNRDYIGAGALLLGIAIILYPKKKKHSEIRPPHSQLQLSNSRPSAISDFPPNKP